ncbi:uncharacterized protein LOC129374419 [Poeciliopsis prolifica]|uniref:uncharacterized protein LOC129374419 n=1 Tax=Poeciliopsis prolifica TaxID=188132 RepID=UPI002413279C|nr:uncharacterized protein LOC129374419 [Poeciliopsis prolifica]
MIIIPCVEDIKEETNKEQSDENLSYENKENTPGSSDRQGKKSDNNPVQSRSEDNKEENNKEQSDHNDPDQNSAKQSSVEDMKEETNKEQSDENLSNENKENTPGSR